jgi:hypothetical protein
VEIEDEKVSCGGGSGGGKLVRREKKVVRREGKLRENKYEF